MKIIGAGMAGCLAGVLNPSSTIFEANKSLPDNHKAVLRFREKTISDATGIPFKKVKVHKGIYLADKGSFVNNDPRIMNWYSQKVIGSISPRSIANIDPVERYVAPSNFHQLLAEMCGDRINYGCPVHSIDKNHIMFGVPEHDSLTDPYILPRGGQAIISTIPMNVLMECLGWDYLELFTHKSISVARYKVKDCDIHQTIYYPELDYRVYRATITGDDLMIEYSETPDIHPSPLTIDEAEIVFASFGISDEAWSMIEFEGDTKQNYGKISPINEQKRRRFMLEATTVYGIYSLGRYACWRNILLDDVYNDIIKIRSMADRDGYEHWLRG